MDERLQKAFEDYLETSGAHLPVDQRVALHNLLEGVDPGIKLTPSLARNLSARAQAVVRFVQNDERPYPQFNTPEFWALVEENRKATDDRFGKKIIYRPRTSWDNIGGRHSPERNADYLGDHKADED